MTLFLTIEASQPNGKCFRLALGCKLGTWLVSMGTALARLF
ncbi:MAG: hypothetical protein U1F37_12040 [Alphaproteobacteria bacterium]